MRNRPASTGPCPACGHPSERRAPPGGWGYYHGEPCEAPRAEADLLLGCAVEGARRILARGLFTIPRSSAELLREWMADVDPVRAWAAERLEVTREPSEIAAAALRADFVLWTERQGFSREQLPNPKAFGRRLMAAAPGLEKKHSDGIVYRNARLAARRAGDAP